MKTFRLCLGAVALLPSLTIWTCQLGYRKAKANAKRFFASSGF